MQRQGRAVAMISIVALYAMHVAAAQSSTDIEKEGENYAVDLSVAATLVASNSFMILIMYMTNSQDNDIRKNTYEVLSMTISIFCAVLVFQAVNDIVKAVVISQMPAWFELIADFFHMLCWFLVLQGSLAISTGNLAKVSNLAGLENDMARKLIEDADFRDPSGNAEVDGMRLLMDVKCFSTLFAHATGFAAINAWGTLQHMSPFASSPVLAVLVVPISYLGQFVFLHCANLVRETVMAGSTDDEESNRQKIWDESAEDAENDIMGIVVSFTFVQAVRFLLSGSLPDKEGVAQEGTMYDLAQAVILLICGALFLVAGAFAYLVVTQGDYSDESTGDTAGGFLDLHRHGMIGQTAMVTAQAWCLFYGMLCLFVSGGWEAHAALLVSVALSVSILAFAACYVLDQVGDKFRAERDTTRDIAVRRSISGLGLLVGFAWEQCFDKAAETISEQSGYPHTVTLALALFCSFLLIPAWKWYMLPYSVTESWLEMGGLVVQQMHTSELRAIRDKLEEKIKARREDGRISVGSRQQGQDLIASVRYRDPRSGSMYVATE